MKKRTLLAGLGLLASAATMAMPSAALASTSGSASASAAIGAGSLAISGGPSPVTFAGVTLSGAQLNTSSSPSCGASPNGCISITDATGSGNG